MRGRRLSAWALTLILGLAIAPAAAAAADAMEDVSWIEAIDPTDRTLVLNGDVMKVTGHTRILARSGARSTFDHLRGPMRSGAGADAVRFRAKRLSSRGPWMLIEVQVVDPDEME